MFTLALSFTSATMRERRMSSNKHRSPFHAESIPMNNGRWLRSLNQYNCSKNVSKWQLIPSEAKV
jgi:hypothetical protein